MIEGRIDANARFFGEEAARVAELALRLAERFRSGGRLLAVGTSPQESADARRVALAFAAPAKAAARPLPALALRPTRSPGWSSRRTR